MPAQLYYVIVWVFQGKRFYWGVDEDWNEKKSRAKKHTYNEAEQLLEEFKQIMSGNIFIEVY